MVFVLMHKSYRSCSYLRLFDTIYLYISLSGFLIVRPERVRSSGRSGISTFLFSLWLSFTATGLVGPGVFWISGLINCLFLRI